MKMWQWKCIVRLPYLIAPFASLRSFPYDWPDPTFGMYNADYLPLYSRRLKFMLILKARFDQFKFSMFFDELNVIFSIIYFSFPIYY